MTDSSMPEAVATPVAEELVTFTREEVVNFTAQVTRMAMGRLLGGQRAYEGQRDYDKVLGYKTVLEFDDYLLLYTRQDIAGRIVDLPARDTWRKPPKVTEGDATDTPFVQAWDALVKSTGVWSMLSRADKLSGIGEYGVLVIGLKDLVGPEGAQIQAPLDEPVEQGSLSSVLDVLYLRPYSQGRASISRWDKNLESHRYGLPLEYSVKLTENTAPAAVHWSRVLHLADGKLDSEVFGLPRLQRAANRLADLLKLVGGTSEATWLGMRPGMIVGAKEGWKDNLPEDDWTEAVRSLTHDIPRIMRASGLEAQILAPGEVLNPTGPFEVLLALIAAASDIPQRVLVGSAGGELSAAEEDTKQWGGQIEGRQQNYAEDEILRPFVDRMIWYGALPMPANGPGGYDIGTLTGDGTTRLWPSIIPLNESEQSDIRLKDAQAAKVLSDPITGQFPITEGEKRETLGYPPLKEDELEALVSGLIVNDKESDYGKSIRAAVRGLWNGKLDMFGFVDTMIGTIRGLRQAWEEGAKKAGIEEVELTQEELTKIDSIISQEQSAVFGFGNDIQAESKMNGFKLDRHLKRAVMWSLRYRDVTTQGMLSARANPKILWTLGGTLENCRDCLAMDKRVYRKETWERYNIRTQSPDLECTGRNCDCRQTPTKLPITPGRPPNLEGPS